MKKSNYTFISATIAVMTLFSPLSYSETQFSSASKTRSGSALDLTRPHYTFIKDCENITNHNNAAFTELSCKSIGEYQVKISAQSPQYFNIILVKNNYKISTDFTVLSNENPIEAGKTIEWHQINHIPKYMIFRLSWGTDKEPFKMRQYLVISLITENKICPLATIDVKNNKNANNKVRNLIINQFKQTVFCPETVATY